MKHLSGHRSGQYNTELKHEDMLLDDMNKTMIYKALQSKTKTWETRTPKISDEERGYSGRVSSSCSTSGISCVALVNNPVVSH